VSAPGPPDLLSNAAPPAIAARAARRRGALAVFAGVFLVLLAFSPFELRGMGYSQEEVAAAFRLLSWATGAVDAPPAAALLSGQGVLSRHGLVEPLVKLPFAAAGRALAPFFPASPRFAERVVTLVPVV